MRILSTEGCAGRCGGTCGGTCAHSIEPMFRREAARPLRFPRGTSNPLAIPLALDRPAPRFVARAPVVAIGTSASTALPLFPTAFGDLARDPPGEVRAPDRESEGEGEGGGGAKPTPGKGTQAGDGLPPVPPLPQLCCVTKEPGLRHRATSPLLDLPPAGTVCDKILRSQTGSTGGVRRTAGLVGDHYVVGAYCPVATPATCEHCRVYQFARVRVEDDPAKVAASVELAKVLGRTVEPKHEGARPGDVLWDGAGQPITQCYRPSPREAFLHTVDCPGGYDQTGKVEPGIETPVTAPAGTIEFITCFYSSRLACDYTHCCVEWQLEYRREASDVLVNSRFCFTAPPTFEQEVYDRRKGWVPYPNDPFGRWIGPPVNAPKEEKDRGRPLRPGADRHERDRFGEWK